MEQPEWDISQRRDKRWTLTELEAELLKGLASGPGEPITSTTRKEMHHRVALRSSNRQSEQDSND